MLKKRSRYLGLALICATVTVSWAGCGHTGSQVTPVSSKHNAVLFIADGLRHGMVTAENMPNLYALSKEGTSFENSHSLYPTLTLANASAISTGHTLDDTGIYANALYFGFPVVSAANSPIVFMENDPVLKEGNTHFDDDMLGGDTLISAARKAGYQTAVIGKLGPALVHDLPGKYGTETFLLDDQTGSPVGMPLSETDVAALKAAGLATATPSRGENGNSGTFEKPGTRSANVAQQDYMVKVATQVVLPRFQQSGKPFVLVFWSRDPDGSQHNQGDSLNKLVPGINGPTTLAALKNVDNNLGALRAALDKLGLSASTDILITSDHGFSVSSKQSSTSPSTRRRFPDAQPGYLPPGFLAIDLGEALSLSVFDADKINDPAHPEGRNPLPRDGHSTEALLGSDATHLQWGIAANGGSDLIYLLDESDGAKKVQAAVDALLAQDYVSGIFVNDRFGQPAGTLPLSAIRLQGNARMPLPAIVISFKSFDTGACANPLNCGAIVADASLQEGQGNHGSFGRQDTFNFQAAIGPDFKRGFVNNAPTSNADLANTLGQLLGIQLAHQGKDVGRVLAEILSSAQPASIPQPAAAKVGYLESAPAANGLKTRVRYQDYSGQRYFDAGGFDGRTIGLSE